MTLNGNTLAPYGDGTNFVNWVPVATGVPGIFGRIGFANGIYVGLTGASRAYTNLVISTNGRDWTLRGSHPFYSYEDGESSSFRIASDGQRFVTVGSRLGTFYYDGLVHVSDPLAGIEIANASPLQLNVTGVTGRNYRVDFVPALPVSATNPWQVLTNFTLVTSPSEVIDADQVLPQRFYRAVLLP